MKYKFDIGQEVVLRPPDHESTDLRTNVLCTVPMTQMAGRTMHIVSRQSNHGRYASYQLLEDPFLWYWIEDWLEPVMAEEPEDPSLNEIWKELFV